MEQAKVAGVRLLGPDELVLELGGEFCIETSGQQVHRRLMAAYLEGRLEGPGAEGALDLLGRFLAQEDFGAIRAADPALAGGQRAEVRVWRSGGGAVRWEKLSPSAPGTD